MRSEKYDQFADFTIVLVSMITKSGFQEDIKPAMSKGTPTPITITLLYAFGWKRPNCYNFTQKLLTFERIEVIFGGVGRVHHVECKC